MCRELRRNMYSSREVFQKIPPLRIEWASESKVDRIWEHDDMFMRIIVCISDICVLRWQMTEVDFLSEATIALTDVLHTRLSTGFPKHVDVKFVMSFSRILSMCFFSEYWNEMPDEKDKSEPTMSVVKRSENMESALIEELPEILSVESEKDEIQYADDAELTLYNESNEILQTSNLQDCLLSCKNYVLENEMLEKCKSVLEFPQNKAMSSLFEVSFKESFDGQLLDNFLQVAATIMDVQQPLLQRNESIANRIFESEKEISLDIAKRLNVAHQFQHSSVMYSTQSVCLELLDNEDSLNVPDANYKSPVVLSEVESSLSEFDSLLPQRGEDSLLYTDDGRVCLGDNSSFSIMYTNRCYQTTQAEDRSHLEHEVKEVPGICDQGGDHADVVHLNQDKKAEEKVTVLKVDVNLHQPVGDSENLDLIEETNRNKELEPECASSVTTDLLPTQSEVPSTTENAPSLDSPNRSFCFTSTPAQSSNASLSTSSTSARSTMSSKSSRIPQIKEAGFTKGVVKTPGMGYPLPRQTSQRTPVATPRSPSDKDVKCDQKNSNGAKTSVKLNMANRDSKIPRPSIPSNGDDSSRSAVVIPSSRVTSRMSEQSSSSLSHVPAASSTLKAKSSNPSLSSPKSSVVSSIASKPGSRNTPTSRIPSKPTISSGGSVNSTKDLRSSVGHVAKPTSALFGKSSMELVRKPTMASSGKQTMGPAIKPTVESPMKHTVGPATRQLGGLTGKPSLCSTVKPAYGSASKPTTGPVTMSDTELNDFVGKIKAKVKSSRENQEEIAKIFNEALMGNSSFNFRENTLSSMQLAKVLSKFEPSMATHTIKDRQKIAVKLMNPKEQKVDLKTLIASCNR